MNASDLSDQLRPAGLRVTAPRVSVQHVVCRSGGRTENVDCVAGARPCLVQPWVPPAMGPTSHDQKESTHYEEAR